MSPRRFYGFIRAVKRDILAHDGYGDPALKMRCHGKALWAARRAAQKIFQFGNLNPI